MITPDANRLVVETEDAVSFSLLLATPLSRAMALVIDLGVIYALQVLINLALIIPFTLAPDAIQAVIIVSYFVLGIGYFMFLEYAWGGQTVGKRVMKIRVIDAYVQQLTTQQIIVRNLLRVVDMLPVFYSLGGIVAMANRKFQRLGDIAASTIVIRSRSHTAPEIPNSVYNKFNSFRRFPHIEANLKKNSLPEENNLALQAVQRRDALDPAARIRVFQALAEHFRSKATFPVEVVNDLTDEQYVRNCVDSIFRKR